MNKAIAKAKLLISKHIKITRETKKKVYFEVAGFKGSYNKDMKQAPEWFTNWSTAFEKRNNKRFDTLESKVDKNSENIEKILNCPTIKKEIEK